MRELFVIWSIGVIMIAAGGYFLYEPAKEITEHARRYREDKEEGQLTWWYLQWLSFAWELAFGAIGRPGVVISLIVLAAGVLIVAACTFRIVVG